MLLRLRTYITIIILSWRITVYEWIRLEVFFFFRSFYFDTSKKRTDSRSVRFAARLPTIADLHGNSRGTIKRDLYAYAAVSRSRSARSIIGLPTITGFSTFFGMRIFAKQMQILRDESNSFSTYFSRFGFRA